MEYIDKSEIIQFLKGRERQALLEGEGVSIVREVIDFVNSQYSYRPTLQAQWVRRGDVIVCSRCGNRTLSYKNTKYCPECGRLMANGRTFNDQK